MERSLYEVLFSWLSSPPPQFQSCPPREDDSFTRPKEKTARAQVRGPRTSVRGTTATRLVNPWTMEDSSFSRALDANTIRFFSRSIPHRVRGGVDLRRAITRPFHPDEGGGLTHGLILPWSHDRIISLFGDPHEWHSMRYHKDVNFVTYSFLNTFFKQHIILIILIILKIFFAVNITLKKNT